MAENVRTTVLTDAELDGISGGASGDWAWEVAYAINTLTKPLDAIGDPQVHVIHKVAQAVADATK